MPKNDGSERHRPRTYIQQTRRAQLVGCAIEVLAEIGYARASLVRIAECAGVSRGVITYHFADRDDLIEAVVTQVYDTARTVLQPRVEAAPTANEAIRTFIIGSAEFYRDYPDQMAALHEIIVNARDADGTLRHTRQGEAEEQELAAVGALLERGQAAGEFRDFSTWVVARTIRYALNGLLQNMLAGRDMDVIAEAEELADLFERAIRVHGSPAAG
jgi:AcrR family transcriptional regulator